MYSRPGDRERASYHKRRASFPASQTAAATHDGATETVGYYPY